MDLETANPEMVAAWDGAEGASWAELADHYDAGTRAYNTPMIEAARISSPDRVLDVGCGNGGSTRAAARVAAAGSALGLDLSSHMLARARERSASEGISNVEFVQGDAQIFPFEPGTFDAAISRFGVMFFSDPVAAFANIGRSLKQDGRLAVLAWNSLERNEWLTLTRESLAAGRDLPQPPIGGIGPFGLADPDRTKEILSGAGYTEIDIVSLELDFFVGEDTADACAFFENTGPVRGLLQDLDDATRAASLEKLRAALADHETENGVIVGSSAWLITAAH